MKTDPPGPIAVPLQSRLRIARLRYAPVILFLAAAVVLALFWKGHAVGSTFVAQAEPVESNVSCYKPGVVTELKVNRFQRVKAGEIVGSVMIAEPRVLTASLALIQAQIDMLRSDLKPVVVQQRTAMDYDQLRLDWMKQRTQLASARVNLQVAEGQYRRMEDLFKDKIISERTFDEAKGNRDRLQTETEELAKLVAEGEKDFQTLQLTNSADITKVSSDPLKAAIAVEESKLRLTEADLAPIILKAPIDGVVTTVYHRSGESVTAGQPILGISTLDPVRIVGYLRPPVLMEPKVGMEVEVRNRGPRQEAGRAKVIEVGTQYESVPAVLLGPVNFANIQMGLPVDISVPAQLKIRPGEIVDVRFVSKVN